jgi:UDP-2-acetamido-3-amino-2,3-dideoxy-glucuronate N-acetyltransferase
VTSSGEPAQRTTRLTGFNDHRGVLTVGETPEGLPFQVERFFLVSNVPEGEPRGIHAHKECHQFLVCVAGSVKALFDDATVREVVSLDQPHLGLHMPPLTCGAQYDFSPDAVLLVLASHRYDPDDYIHEYDEFLVLSGQGGQGSSGQGESRA